MLIEWNGFESVARLKRGTLASRKKVLEAAEDVGSAAAQADGEACGGEHADGDGFPVCELVVGAEFEGVTNGVSEVEDISDAEFVELVFRDDGSFERNAVADDGGDRFRIAL
jgi:hypothetical protein